MIAALAQHQGDASALTPDVLERDLFGPLPWIQALVADSGEEGLIGYAIYRKNKRDNAALEAKSQQIAQRRRAQTTVDETSDIGSDA